ncbi:MAG: hypothetical protein EXR03_08795 [Pseudolabrys sp.]|nr:hypothetical protein [Pseudolabrys sp.]MSP32898.1 hypothetical protein [Pseudolabrys sp.]
MLSSASSLFAGAAMLLAALALPAAAQDIRGLEACTAEKQMERRTGCLQANVEFLQQALAKLARETNAKLAAVQTEIAALKEALAKLDGELAQMRAKAAPASKK